MLSPGLRFAIVLAPAIAALAGCANRHPATVGAVPDDYRTNHPIMIAEKEQVLDLPVGRSDRRATRAQVATLEGFLGNYDRSAAPALTILTPSGSGNAHAAAQAAQDFARVAKRNGVPESRILISSYQAGSAEVAAPVRISFVGITAHTNKCGRWPEDIASTEQNRHYANFGCSYQSNLAAQIANPTDLLGPRKPTPIDAQRRDFVIDDYRNAPSDWAPESEY